MSEEDAVPARRSTDIPADAPWWARWLDANAKEAWKWASVWWPGFCAALIEFWAQLPADQQQGVIDWFVTLIPVAARPHLLAGVFGVSILFRVLNLRPKKDLSKQNP